MANRRKLTDADAVKFAAKLSAGSTLEQAIEAVNWSLEDWHRFHTDNKDLQTMYLQAMRDRSTLLLERTLDIERQLNELDVSASATDVAAMRLRADILQKVAIAHDSSLVPSQQVTETKGESLVDMLKRVQQTEKEEGVKQNPKVGGSQPNEPLDVNVKGSKLTH